MNYSYFALVFSITIGFLTGCRPTSEITMPNPSVNWQALSFVCHHEEGQNPPDREAEAWYQEANALYRLGMAKERTVDFVESVKLLRRAAERGHIKAMNNLVLAYLNGEGIAQSDSAAVEWVERLIQNNSGMGYYHMGVFLEQGIGVKSDRKAALTYFRKAADLGNAQGQLVVGRKVAEAVAQTTERTVGFQVARMMLQCALDQGLAEAGYYLGKHYQIAEEKVPEALESFQASAKLGHSQSLWTLSFLFDGRSSPGPSPDAARAACYVRLAREADEDKTKTFPNLDKVCPLPPRPMPAMS